MADKGIERVSCCGDAIPFENGTSYRKAFGSTWKRTKKRKKKRLKNWKSETTFARKILARRGLKNPLIDEEQHGDELKKLIFAGSRARFDWTFEFRSARPERQKRNLEIDRSRLKIANGFPSFSPLAVFLVEFRAITFETTKNKKNKKKITIRGDWSRGRENWPDPFPRGATLLGGEGRGGRTKERTMEFASRPQFN